MIIKINKYYNFETLSLDVLDEFKIYKINIDIVKKIPIISNMMEVFEEENNDIEIELNIAYQVFEFVIKFLNNENIISEDNNILFYSLNDKSALIYLGFEKTDKIMNLIEEYFYDRKVNKDPLELAIEFDFEKSNNEWCDDNIFNLPKINGEYLEEDKIYIEECKKYYKPDEYLKISDSLIYTNEKYISKYSTLPEKIKKLKENNDCAYKYFENK